MKQSNIDFLLAVQDDLGRTVTYHRNLTQQEVLLTLFRGRMPFLRAITSSDWKEISTKKQKGVNNG